MQCPVCGCDRFYVKDPDDEFETYCFVFRDGERVFDSEVSCASEIKDCSEVFCDRCSWHGNSNDL